MGRRYRILATAPVEVMDEERDVTEAEWRSLDGRSFVGEGLSFAEETTFARETVEGEAGPQELLSGGFLRFEQVDDGWQAVIEFTSPRPLSESERRELVMELEATLWEGLGDSIRWDHGLDWLAFGEITLREELIAEEG